MWDRDGMVRDKGIVERYERAGTREEEEARAIK